MKNLSKLLIGGLLATLLIAPGCSSMNRTQKGVVIGTGAGAGMGAVIGKASGNTALGAIIGAAVGGTAGALIGNKMDKQAQEIKASVPDAEVIRVGEGIVVEFSNKVLFAFGKSDLTPASKGSLDKLIKVLNTYPDTDIEVQGHTDSKGTEAFNQTLSENRAAAVSRYLIDRNITARRVTITGFGEMLPKYLNSTEDGRDKNRRVEFVITANEQMKKDAKQQAQQ
jgi:outer membrane protein OmpA-like peptidoglycan-associated protein